MVIIFGNNSEKMAYSYSEVLFISFQLFEMGLELSLARLKALAKYAFGMGLTQVWCFGSDHGHVKGIS